MRRSSVVGPLLLICIGALFLARNIFPELQLLEFMARYWPYLLIVWGGLRLVEIGIWAATGKPMPTRGMSGGEWMLVVFLIFLGVSVHAARGFSTWFPGRSGITMGGLDMFGESYDYTLAGEKATSKTPKIVLQSFRGNAHITGGDVDAVKVTGHTTIRSLDRESADRANQNSPLELVVEGSQVTIRTNQDRVSSTQRPSAELDITVPRGASLELHGRAGDFDVTNINGPVEITSDSASVRLDNIAGEVKLALRSSDSVRAVNLKSSFELKGRGNDVDLDSIEGQVTLDGVFVGIGQLRNLAKPVRVKNQFFEFTAERVTGSVRASIGDFSGSGITGPVRLTATRSKDVTLTDFTGSLQLEVARGDVTLQPGTNPIPKMDVRTRNGDIELAMPASAKFDLTATSERGDLDNEFGAPISQDNGRHGGSLHGSNGGPTVTLQTSRGTIRIRKASDAPAAKAPVAPVAPAAPQPPLRPLNQ